MRWRVVGRIPDIFCTRVEVVAVRVGEAIALGLWLIVFRTGRHREGPLTLRLPRKNSVSKCTPKENLECAASSVTNVRKRNEDRTGGQTQTQIILTWKLKRPGYVEVRSSGRKLKFWTRPVQVEGLKPWRLGSEAPHPRTNQRNGSGVAALALTIWCILETPKLRILPL